MQCEYSQKYLLLQYCGLFGELLESSQRFLMRNFTVCTVYTLNQGARRFLLTRKEYLAL